MLTVQELADRICEEVDAAKGAHVGRLTAAEGLGRPVIWCPIQPETRAFIAALIENWAEHHLLVLALRRFPHSGVAYAQVRSR